MPIHLANGNSNCDLDAHLPDGHSNLNLHGHSDLHGHSNSNLNAPLIGNWASKSAFQIAICQIGTQMATQTAIRIPI